MSTTHLTTIRVGPGPPAAKRDRAVPDKAIDLFCHAITTALYCWALTIGVLL